LPPQERAAARTGVGDRPLAHREVAVWVAVTAVEQAPALAPAGSLHYQVALPALGAFPAGRPPLVFDVPALGLAGASDERPEPPPLLGQRLPAFRACLLKDL